MIAYRSTMARDILGDFAMIESISFINFLLSATVITVSVDAMTKPLPRRSDVFLVFVQSFG